MINHIIYIIFIILITIIIIDIYIVINIIICSDCHEMPLGIGISYLRKKQRGAMNGASPLEMELDMEG